jgi:tetratricopeptide (TPR) repeat protein
MKNIIALFILYLSITTTISAQSGANDILYQKGLKAKEEYKYQEGLALFQILLKSDSSNVDYLANTSYFLSRVGQLQPSEDQKMDYYHKAEYIGKKAVQSDPNNAEAHYAYALAIARINEFAGNKQKISNAKLLKTELDICLKLNPQHSSAWHILGRWHREIANLNGVERLAINSFFGGVPPNATFEDAITCFQNAIKYNPTYILHYFELAKTYYTRDNKGDKELAIAQLNIALALPNIAPDDPENRKNCEALLKKLQ